MATSDLCVRHSREDGVCRITLDRPEALNALTPGMRDRLVALLDAASADPETRAVVLTGTGRAFCAGADLRGGAAGGERRTGDVARTLRLGAQRLIAAVLDCEKPVIAAVNGTAAGGGANLALACDLVVMADSAKLIEIFVKRGIIPDAGGCYLLPRIVGPLRAKELMFLGDELTAADCERWGIANRVVPQAELATTVDELAARLAAGPSKAIAMTKWLVNRSSESSRHSAFEEEAYAQELVTATADMAEGIAAFGQRRPPAFKGW